MPSHRKRKLVGKRARVSTPSTIKCVREQRGILKVAAVTSACYCTNKQDRRLHAKRPWWVWMSMGYFEEAIRNSRQHRRDPGDAPALPAATRRRKADGQAAGASPGIKRLSVYTKALTLAMNVIATKARIGVCAHYNTAPIPNQPKPTPTGQANPRLTWWHSLTSIKRAPKQRSETLELGQPQLRLISENAHCSHISATSDRDSGLFPPSCRC